MNEIKKILNEKSLTIGTEKTLKKLRAGKLKKIFLSSNCPDNIKRTINYYANISNIEVINLDISNEELGITCKKPFHISVISY